MLWGPLSKPRQTLMEISPPDGVKRRVMASGGTTAEVVRATRGAKIELRFRAPLHLLAMYEQGARRKLAFVPAGHEFRDSQEVKMPLRAVCFYFEPARLPNATEVMAPRPFFEDAALVDTALKVARLIESPRSDIGPYFEALCAVLAHELVGLDAAPAGSEHR